MSLADPIVKFDQADALGEPCGEMAAEPPYVAIVLYDERTAHTDLLPVHPPKRWRSPQNTTILAGDSCHAILPYLGQGLNLGMEDAAVLGCLLGHVQSRDQIPKVAEMYESLRMGRAATMLEKTVLQAAEYHSEDPEVIRKRDENFVQHGPNWQARPSYLLEKGSLTFPIRSIPGLREWIWSYDAYAEAEAAYQANPF